VSVRPKKRLGQHFLTDANVIGKIVDAVGAPPGAPVVEIGPGEGALTGPLLARYPGLTAVEVDPEAVAHLRARFPALRVLHADVLDLDWAALAAEAGGPLWVVGNLPYYITSPILFGLLDARTHLRRAVVMMQREVAERIVAAPGTKAYGILSVQAQLFARPALLFRVSRHVFRPKPDVESAVLALDFLRESDDFGGPDPEGVDSDALRRVVRTAFGQRRKMLRNSLAALDAPHPLPPAFAARRPEALTPAEFVALAQALYGADGR
jgi:16S rRNA (adenine1518-N6/adenine1519-N6)-dimethyltransferase